MGTCGQVWVSSGRCGYVKVCGSTRARMYVGVVACWYVWIFVGTCECVLGCVDGWI